MVNIFFRIGDRLSFLTGKTIVSIIALLLLSSSGLVNAQTTIKGHVVDERTKEPIIGAIVLIKSTTKGVSTDINGQFELKTSKKLPLTLSISLVGYRTQDIDVYDTEEPVYATLTEDVNRLNEVVVVGYGTQSKKSFSGAAAHVNGDIIKELPVQSFDQALSGRAAGVSIAEPNGLLNNPPVIRIRGVNSISLSSYPLVVIDGIPVSTGNISTTTDVPNNPLADINPSDIESIDVLKDAASTSIYGSRAAAGVLLITTKRGKAGKVKTTYEGWVGITNAVRLPKLLNSQQYVDIKNEAVLNSKILSGNANNDNVSSKLFFPSYNADGSLVDTNWYDYIYRTAVSHNHVVTLSGGTEKTNYYFSANYSNQEGFLVDNDFQRKGIRFNIDHEVNKWLRIKGNGSYNTTNNRANSSGSLPGSSQFLVGAARMAISTAPNISPYNADGSYNLSSTGKMGSGNNLASSALYNPLALFEYSRSTSDNDRFIGGISANIKLLKHLDFNTIYSIDRLKTETVSFLSPKFGSSGYADGGSATNVSALRDNQTFTNTLNYDQVFNNKHHVSALLGTDLQKYKTSIWGAKASKASDDFFENYQGGWTNYSPASNYLGERAFYSYFSRLSYDFEGKYLFTANLRRDGNSALAVGHKYGNFGGISGGWVISQEKFFRKSSLGKLFDQLKLNASWGRVGNGNLTDDFGSFDLYSSSLYGSVSTWAISQSGNPLLSWETSNQTNIGLNAELLKKRLSVEVAYFNNNVNGLILDTPQSPSKGIPGNSILTNVGSMYNRGVELTLNASLIQKKKFSWDVSFNFTGIKNEVTQLAGNNADIIGYTHTSANANNVTRVGYSVGSLFGAKTAGVNPENGRRIFINGKGEKVQYSAVVPSGESNWTYLDGTKAPAIGVSDYYVLGNALPKWYGGLVSNLKYKNWDLTLNFTYAGGNYVMNGTKATLRDQTSYNNYTGILDRWTTPGQVTDIPRLVYNDIISNGTSFPISANVEKADFLRLQNVLLAYRVPANLLSKVNLSSAKIYAQVSNAFLITGYTGTDPESSVNGNSNTTPGVERNSLGRGRTFTFGVNVGF
ncbi:TonB-dependent receptor [uncultured Bacteroides sp.]|uniref:SusC/RagA family TonB-linked outer membrane protein n=1 Tax=uncultured Bacteroides sp. TaxID=162156 RepID=UPI002AA9169A|nr:TonB-dependent receptor [uncultured Bacteroides sp.]